MPSVIFRVDSFKIAAQRFQQQIIAQERSFQGLAQLTQRLVRGCCA